MLPKFLSTCCRALLVALLLPAAWPAHAQQPSFLEPEQAFRLAVQPHGKDAVTLQWRIAPGYYLYRDRVQVRPLPSTGTAEFALPPGVRKDDPNFGGVEIYHDQLRVEVTPAGATALDVRWQGCAEGGVCYPPQQRQVTLANAAAPDRPLLAEGIASVIAPATGLPHAQPSAAAAPPAPAAPGVIAGSERDITSLLVGRPLLWTVPLFLVLGIGLAFTPCVLPMLPIISAVVVGSGARAARAFALSLAFVLAMAAVYTLLGIGAALAGGSLQGILQNPLTIGATAALFLALSMSMFGWYELQVPAFLRERLARASATGGSIAGAAAMGALSALLVSPCMTAPLAGTLIYVAQSGNVMQGAALLFALGLGMGLPLLVLSTVGARALPRPGPWMNRVKSAFGFALLATAVAMLQRIVPPSAAVLLWGAWLTALAVTLWTITAAAGARIVARSAALVAALWGAAMIIGASAGAADPLLPLAPLAQRPASLAQASADEPLFETVTDPQQLRARLAAASASGRPALVDFSADWCTSCRTLDREVFGDPAVRRALASVVRLRADVTAGDSAQRALMRDLQVMGPPTVMLFDALGHELRQDRLVGDFSAADLLERVASVANRS